ncbi:serine hydrolase domain-containing protein [Kordiimonas gwangyangensis]|uniref:serine hydrolase domain-containing protein n=1 Tax=Kordiimonas gwangyangensis TaxID=288022 RepID=UPI00037816EB|nr:serine hydrolase domain-containing protein [Kordiimonas gwangyangensis]
MFKWGQNTFGRWAATLGLATMIGVGTAGADTPDVTDAAQVEAFVDGVVKPLMQKEHSPSGVVAVMKDGKVIFQKGYGYIDVEKRIPVDAATSMFRPGSISKLFTWISVMQLAEQGKLDIDTDVNEYVTQFKVKDTFPGQPVTLRHIMTHTAGFEDGALGYLINNDPDVIMPLAEALEKYQPTRVVAPGTRVAYSNWATALAGLIVANVSGENFNDYVQKHIFGPLGMTHSTFVEPLPADLEPYMAKAYTYGAGKYKETPYEIIANFGPAGASAVSAADMANFARALLNGGEYNGARILKEETLQQMLTEGFAHDPRARGMGLGFIKRDFGGPAFENFGHDGGTTIFISHFGLSIPNDFMLFSSFSGPGAGPVHQAFVENFYDEFFPQELPYVEPPADFQTRGQKYAGSYVTSRSSYTKVESILRGLGSTDVAVMPDNTLLIGETRYVEVDKNVFRQVDDNDQIIFTENDKGEITGYVMDGIGVMKFYPAKFYETKGYISLVLGVCLTVFVFVFIRLALQWSRYRGLEGQAKNAYRATLLVSAANILFFVFIGITLAGGMQPLFYSIPGTLKFAFVFPIIAVLATLYHLYTTFLVWRDGLFEGVWARVRHTIVALAAVWILTFYQAWNLIGFNYFA